MSDDLLDMRPQPNGPRTHTFDVSAHGRDTDARLHTLVHSSMGIHELTKGLRLHFPDMVPLATLNELRAIAVNSPDAAVASLRDMVALDERLGSALDYILDRLIFFSGHTRDGLMRPRQTSTITRGYP